MTLHNLTRDHISLLLGHMLIDPRMCRECCTNLESEWFTRPEVGGEHWQSFAFSTIKQYFDSFQYPPDPSSFQIGIYDLGQRFINPQDPYFAQFQGAVSTFVNQFMPTVSASSHPLAEAVYDAMVNRCLFDAEVKGLVTEAAQLSSSTSPSAATELATLAQKMLDVEKRRARTFKGVSSQGLMMKQDKKPRTKTGIDFLDSRMGRGRGPVRGSVAGIIMPQGGGKTTLGNQIAVTQALMGRPSLIVIAEQGWDMDYQRNVWTCATGIPSHIIEDCGDDLYEAAKINGDNPDEIMARLEAVSKNLRWIDLLELNGDFEAAEDEIVRLSESSTDKPLEVVYIDWASAIGHMMLARGYRGSRPSDIREATTVLAQALERIASQNELFIAISQQMAGQHALGSPYKENNEYCALDNTMFTAQFRYTMVVNKKCPRTKLQVAAIPKARNDPVFTGTDRFVLRLDGPKARFDEAEDYAVGNGRIMSKKFQDTSAVPKE